LKKKNEKYFHNALKKKSKKLILNEKRHFRKLLLFFECLQPTIIAVSVIKSGT